MCVERLDFIHHLLQHLRRISSLRCRARPAVFCIAFWQAAFFACAAVVRATVLCSLLSLRISRHLDRNTLMVVAFVFNVPSVLFYRTENRLPFRRFRSLLTIPSRFSAYGRRIVSTTLSPNCFKHIQAELTCPCTWRMTVQQVLSQSSFFG